MQELRIDNFVIFRNKKIKPAQPDYKGQINLDGVIYELVCWVKIDKKGDQYLSGTVNNPIDDDQDVKGIELQGGSDITMNDFKDIDDAKGIQ